MEGYIEIDDSSTVVKVYSGQFPPNTGMNRIIPLKKSFMKDEENDITNLIGQIVGGTDSKPYPYMENIVVSYSA